MRYAVERVVRLPPPQRPIRSRAEREARKAAASTIVAEFDDWLLADAHARSLKGTDEAQYWVIDRQPESRPEWTPEERERDRRVRESEDAEDRGNSRRS